MAKNTGLGSRIGSVLGRSQVYNPKNDSFVKRDLENGRFMAQKPTPFKGVAREVDGRRK